MKTSFSLALIFVLTGLFAQTRTNNRIMYLIKSEQEKFEGIYISDAKYGSPSGFVLGHQENRGSGTIYAKQFSTYPKNKIDKAYLIRVMGDTLIFGYKNLMSALVVSEDSESATIYSCDYGKTRDDFIINDSDKIVVNKFPRLGALRTLYKIDKGFANDLLKPELRITKKPSKKRFKTVPNPYKKSTKRNRKLPRFEDVRGRLINSSDYTDIKLTLGKPNGEWSQGSLTYKVYYHAATLNGNKVHLRVIWSSLTNRVSSIKYYRPGEIMQIGAYHRLRTPK